MSDILFLDSCRKTVLHQLQTNQCILSFYQLLSVISHLILILHLHLHQLRQVQEQLKNGNSLSYFIPNQNYCHQQGHNQKLIVILLRGDHLISAVSASAVSMILTCNHIQCQNQNDRK